MTNKEKSKIIVKHLEKDFELCSKCGETYVIKSIWNALKEISNCEKEENDKISKVYNKILEQEEKDIDNMIQAIKHINQ